MEPLRELPFLVPFVRCRFAEGGVEAPAPSRDSLRIFWKCWLQGDALASVHHEKVILASGWWMPGLDAGAGWRGQLMGKRLTNDALEERRTYRHASWVKV